MSYNSLSHTKWDHIYHVIFIPYKRKRKLYGEIREFVGSKLRELAQQRGSEILRDTWFRIMFT